MKKLLYCSALFIGVLILFFNNKQIFAQNNSTQSPNQLTDLISKVEQYYSFNDELINGSIYPLPSSKVYGNPYLNDQWLEADLYIHNKTFSNLLIKYDLVSNNVVLKIVLEDDIEQMISLNKFQLDSFLVNNKLFVNSRSYEDNESTFIFYELIYKSKNLQLLKEYDKVFIKEYNNITPYGKYSSLRSDLILYDTKLHKVNRKGSFLEHFSKEQQKQIKAFIKKNKINYNKASNKEYQLLLNFCSELTSK